MAAMIFFKVGSTDLTPWGDIQNYDINRDDVFETWTDGNYVNHREIVRTRYGGKVTLGFDNATDFAAFTALMTSARQIGGYYSVTAYIQNTGETATFDAYLDTDGSGKWDVVNGRRWLVVTVTVTGR